ncbi:putative uncharacterized protein DDB_G0272194 [Cotesia glomerata]|uniref:C3H1-type domain-containing protein n=1 Tax=Cotesia glomerata TaxID=32391 RepID=A0AAV7ILX9_COTGL|nr:putative uncharacterized protein DDB_G0272194 [Cotesia glomerata]KAH0553270.1 hypothetical protein KQX54_001166 [Cotesia glomerata]
MTSLVADYGTSSGSESDSEGVKIIPKVANDDEDDDDDDEDEDEDDITETNQHDDDSNIKNSYNNNKLPLPTPDFNATPTLKTSVFTNPFVEAEKAKSAILEKHVKMTPTLDDTKMINGRKICWNYRKGRCRFGHNCTFAHDSDLHRSAAELEAIRTPQETVICQTHFNNQKIYYLNSDHDDNSKDNDNDDDEIDQENNQMVKRKKRPGLSQSLIPGKKVLKMYKAQQTKAVGR